LLARHRTSAAAATVLLAPRRASLAPEVKLGRPPAGVDYIGLDASRTQLCFTAASKDVREVLRLPRATLRAAGDVSLHTDLLDAQAYVLHASVLPVLAAKPAFASVKRDLLPYLVRRQFDTRPYAVPPAAPCDADAADAEPATPGERESTAVASGGATLSDGPLVLAAAPGVGAGGPGPAPGILRKVGVFLADASAYVVRVDSLRAYLEVNRELASPADGAHLTGLVLSKHDNFLGREVEIGAKSAVGSACIVGWGAKLGDKCTMKRSVMGRRCRTGSSVKIVNSVIHDGALAVACTRAAVRLARRSAMSAQLLEPRARVGPRPQTPSSRTVCRCRALWWAAAWCSARAPTCASARLRPARSCRPARSIAPRRCRERGDVGWR
jgi:NDP-sugar pyrophosphorylase family protein